MRIAPIAAPCSRPMWSMTRSSKSTILFATACQVWARLHLAVVVAPELLAIVLHGDSGPAEATLARMAAPGAKTLTHYYLARDGQIVS